jgi:hypothetical protein
MRSNSLIRNRKEPLYDKKFNFQLDEELFQEITDIARENYLTKGAFVRQSIKRNIMRYRKVEL